MLLELHIENIAVIDSVDVTFGGGFHALTGETGAGKSILIDSINMLLGGRTSKGLIRHGAGKALVQGLFRVTAPDAIKRLEKQGVTPEEDGTLLISRELHPDGRNVCRINGQMAPVAAVKAVGDTLINIHGQHDNQALLNPASHINFLDRFAKETIKPLLLTYIDWFNKVMRTRKALTALQMDETEKQRRLDGLSFEINELQSAGLKPGEEDALIRQRDLLNNSKRLTDSLQTAYQCLSGEEPSAYALLSQAQKGVSDAAEMDAELLEQVQTLTEAITDVEECARSVRAYLSQMDATNGDIDAIEARLHVIYTLKHKYGKEVPNLLEYLAHITQERDAIATSGERIEALKAELAQYTKGLTQAAEALHAERERAAQQLAQDIQAELCYLDMSGVVFQADIQHVPFNRYGNDKVEFLIATNPGQPLAPLSKIVSGGELSRIMLAIKSILADSDPVETLIFDEIDTGVSGRAAQRIGEKMKALSQKKQVLCITHLASIAALADQHYLLEKRQDGQTVSTRVTPLDNDGRAHELARIIGGDHITQTTLRQAHEMMEQ